MTAMQRVAMSGDGVDAESRTLGHAEATEEETDVGPTWSWGNWAVIGLFTLLTAIGMALAAGLVEAAVAVPPTGSDRVIVPPFVYLYAGLGALGYIFTKLMVEFDEYTEWSGLEDLVGMAMRIPAAWILATGIFLLLDNFVPSGTEMRAEFAAGVAFLVGLYVNVAMKGLGSLAERVLASPGRPDRGAPDRSAPDRPAPDESDQ